MKAKEKTGLIFFPAFDWAISKTHPEREERLLYTQDQVFEEGLLELENIVEFKPGMTTYDDINRCHICVNIPLPPKTSDKGFLHVLDSIVLPILDEFQPEIIINSAGQDNHYSDPITDMYFSAQGYALLTEKLAPHICLRWKAAIPSREPFLTLMSV
jgi:acetoin utilization deacetylase AcuC-like enzyme